jgi:hypothetical protein
MHDHRCAHNGATIGSANGLMTKTSTEERDVTSSLADNRDAHPDVSRGTGARTDHDTVRMSWCDVGSCSLVVPHPFDLCSQCASVSINRTRMMRSLR